MLSSKQALVLVKQHLESETPAAVVSKLGVMSAGVFMGFTISEWAALAAFVYTILNIYVLVRDRILLNKRRRNDDKPPPPDVEV